MAKKSDYDWLEDPFNDEKAQKELDEAKKSNNRGLIICLAIVVVVICCILVSCNAATLLIAA